MTHIRLDKVDFSTLHEAPKNYDTIPGSITITGSVADGATATFTFSTPYSRSGSRADIYLDGNSKRVSANSGSRAADAAYVYTSSEIFSVSVSYSTTDVTVSISIFNGTGGPITLVSQTIAVVIVLYDAPISSL